MNTSGNSFPSGGAAAWTVVVLFFIVLVAVCVFLKRSHDADHRTDAPPVAAELRAAETPVATSAASADAPAAAVTPRSPEQRAAFAAVLLAKSEELGAVDCRTVGEAKGSEAQRSAVERLRRALPGVEVEFDAITGAPKQILAAGRFLTPAGGDVDGAVRQFVDGHADLFGHTAAALSNTRVTRNDVTAHNGMTTRVWQQELDGVPLYKTVLKANVTKRGELITLGSHFVADPAAAAGQPPAARAALIAQPPVDAAQAVALAAAGLGDRVASEQTEALTAPEGAERRQQFKAPGLSDTSAGLTWLPMSADSLQLGWDVTLMSLQLGQMFRVVVDAQTGEVLVRTSLTNDATNASYRVYASPASFQPTDSPAPQTPGLAAPTSVQAPVIPRNLVTLQSANPTASPNGWINDGNMETVGNNVDAHTDTDANNSPDLPRPNGGAARVFDYPIDFSLEPVAYKDASVTNLFYLNNWIHDRLYELGFTESAGNFQTDNFGRGGLGNDAVQADAQDGSGTSNANFSTPPDGSPGRMQMFVWSAPTPDRDGDFDNQIVIHEYGHGLSNRLVGGGVGISALQSAGMGEGWSDFYAVTLLAEPADDPEAVYPMSGFALYLASGMTTNYYFGIRRYPYGTDMAKSPLTFKDIDPTQASPHTGVPLSPRYTSSNATPSAVHAQGEVWCNALWEVRRNLVVKHGFAGNELVLQLVTDGMKLAPANPNFLQARDGIVQADLVNNGGANLDEIWAGFAKRGMGASATSPASSTTTGVVEAFDVPDDLNVSPVAIFTAGGPVGGPFTPAAQTYTLTNTGTTTLTWTAAASQPWLAVSPAAGTLAVGASTTVIAAFGAPAAALSAGTYLGSVNFTNLATGALIPRGVTLVSGVSDYFTEVFDTSSNDTDNQSWLFTPNGSLSYYGVTKSSVTAFPTDPTGGTTLALSDDTFVQITPPGVQVSLYGVSYPTFYVGSNGYVTLGAGDSSLGESADAHFAAPRIAGLFDDLDPSAGGTLSWRQLADRIAVTWQAVPEFATTNANSFQLEMYFDGRIRITCLGIAAVDGLIGLSRGQGVPAAFVESDFSAYGTGGGGGPLALTLAIPASATEGAGVLVGQGTATLSAVQPGAVTVSLVSSTPAEAAVPATVTVPAGQLSAPFNVTIGNDAVVDGPQAVIVSASAPGFAGAAGVITVLDNESGGTLSLGAPAAATEGDGTVQGTLTTSVAPGAPLTVLLTSSDPTEAQVPAAVVIPAGQTSVPFPITILDDTAIDGAQPATLTASLGGWTSGAATISVLDNESLNLTVLLPATVTEAATGTGSVLISGTLPTALTVALSSNNPARLTVPATVSIAAGATSANFTATAPNNALTDGSAPATVTASASGFGGGSATTTVLDNDVHHYALAAIASPQTRGVPFSVTITAEDVNNLTLASYTTAALLSASGSGGPVPIAPTATTAFTAGVWTGNVTVNTFGTGIVLTASDGAGHTGASNAFEVGTGPLHHFAWAPVIDPRPVNVPFSTTITAQDAGNNPVTSFTGTANLSGVAAGPAGSSIVITEANPNTPDEIEFMNVGTAPVDLSGWQIYVYDNVSWPAPLAVFTVPAGSTCAAGEIFRLQESGTAPGAFPLFFFGGNIDWTSGSGSQTAVLLRDASGAAVDFLCASASTPASISAPQTIPVDQWSGAPIAAPANLDDGYHRIGSADDNTAADWVTAAPGLGTLNPGLITPFAVPVPVPITPTVSGNFAAGVWTGNVTVLQEALQMRLRADDGAGHVGVTNVFDALGSIHAYPQSVTVPFNTPTPIVLAGVDPLNPSAVLTYIVTTPPAHGSFSGTAPNLTYTPAAGYFGADNFTFTVANGALVSPPATVTLNILPPPAEIVVEQPVANVLIDGAATVNFGTTSVGGGAVSKTFLLRNIGGQSLTLSGITGDGADLASFSFPNLAGVTIPAAGAVSFTVTFDPTTIGVKTAALHIGSNDADENPFDIALTGTVIAAPEIAIEQPAGNGLVDGTATVSFGDAVLGVPVVRTFTVRNSGVLPLNLSSVTIAGADFAAGALSSATVPVGGSATFSVTFAASSTGAKSAVLRVASNDLDEASFDIRLIGIGSAPAGLLRLARDINQTGAGPAITAAAQIGTTIYFSANTAATGAELWKSDGTVAGTVLVRDINGGTASSTPGNFRVIGSTLYFSATTAANGVELWKSDGTTVGTVLVRDIFTGTTSSNPANLTDVAGTLFFTATDSTANGVELWKSDGTTTELVQNINATANASSTPANLTAVGSTLFFSANDGIAGVELWMSDGAGAVLVQDILSGTGSSNPANLVALGGAVFFSATNGTNGIELWRSDGTSTVLVKDIFVGASSSSPTVLVNAGGTLFFRANASGQGVELWKSDGSTVGTVLVRDINPGTLSSTPASLLAVGTGIYFSATDGVNGIELWKSDGTTAGTVLVQDVNPGLPSSTPTNLTRIGDAIYFAATTASGGSELWKADTLAGTTELVKEINPGAAGSAPTVLMNVGGLLVFVANDGANGSELWTSDGTGGGTTLLTDLTPGSANAAPANFRVLNGALLFSATDGVSGTELWTSNGLPGGTTQVRDISPGAANGNPGAGAILGSALYFAATEPTGGIELWKTDGTTVGTARVRDIFSGTGSSAPANLTRVGNTLYFSASDSTANGTELWKSDGTEIGTVLVANINPLASTGSAPGNFIDFNGTLFFTANNGTTGVELWKSDGSATGTVPVRDINLGSVNSSPANLRVVGTTLYFTATTAANGTELWKSDGSELGTVIVADLTPGTTSTTLANLTVVGSTLFFSANVTPNGAELWKSDAGGTVLVRDINPGTVSSSPGNLTNVNGTLFFSAFLTATGTELWTSNGTEAGTVLVKDILPGTNGSSLASFANINGTLYFAANPSATGTELWKSDGTALGTVQAADIRPGNLGSGPANMTVIDSRLFFSATGSDLGTELWILDLAAAEITVEEPAGTPLTDAGSTVNFGNATIGAGGEQTRTFTIRNTAASGTLNGLAVTINGASAANYVASALSATALAPGATATFDVTFTPGGLGTRVAALHLASNDPDENPFDIGLTGVGVAPSIVESWRLANFGTVANAGDAADLADWDFDGVLNLFEFAFGTNPANVASGPGALVISGGLASGTLVSTGQPIAIYEPRPGSYTFRAVFIRRSDHTAAGLTYAPQFSADLLTWYASTAAPTVLSDTGAHQVVSVPYPFFVGGKKARFFRIQVTLAP